MNTLAEASTRSSQRQLGTACCFCENSLLRPCTFACPARLVKSLARIAPTDSKLKAAQDESKGLRALAAKEGIDDLAPDTMTLRAVLDGLLEGDAPVHLWHFACHVS